MSKKMEIEVFADEGAKRSSGKLVKISSEKLRRNLESFTKALSQSFESVSSSVEGGRLSEITVHVTVGAEGSIKLLGSGGSASAEGGISLTYVFDAE